MRKNGKSKSGTTYLLYNQLAHGKRAVHKFLSFREGKDGSVYIFPQKRQRVYSAKPDDLGNLGDVTSFKVSIHPSHESEEISTVHYTVATENEHLDHYFRTTAMKVSKGFVPILSTLIGFNYEDYRVRKKEDKKVIFDLRSDTYSLIAHICIGERSKEAPSNELTKYNTYCFESTYFAFTILYFYVPLPIIEMHTLSPVTLLGPKAENQAVGSSAQFAVWAGLSDEELESVLRERRNYFGRRCLDIYDQNFLLDDENQRLSVNRLLSNEFLDQKNLMNEERPTDRKHARASYDFTQLFNPRSPNRLKPKQS